MVETEILEKLIFYSVLKAEGFLPTEAEYNALYDKMLRESFDAECESSGTSYEAGERYETALKAYEERMILSKGEEYMPETVYYSFGMEKILSLITVKNTAAEN